MSRILAFFVFVIALLPSVSAQSVTGRIVGTVTDPTGAAIPGVTVQLTFDLTHQSRTFTAGENGAFIFANLLPGDYSVHIAQVGFKGYDQKNINVSTQEAVDLHEIKLQLGDLTSSVEVQSETAHVATDSSDRSVAINRTTIESIPAPGREYLGTLRVLPGSQSTDPTTGGGLNGGQAGQVALSVDGIVEQDSGSTGSLIGHMNLNVDAIGEIRVLVSNYNAEYGSRTGGQVSIITKAGTAQYHGTAYYYWRHEQFNANEFFNNKNGLEKAKYRFQNPGGTIGGPVLVPFTKFNRDRTKLFVFYAEDDLLTHSNGSPTRYNMPTALERNGDFSQTVTSTGVPIPIKDPSTGKPYPGNQMPASQISPMGRAMMNLFPLPSTTDPSGLRQFNSQYQFISDVTHANRTMRVDYNLGSKTSSYLRLVQDLPRTTGYSGSGIAHNGGGGWGQFANWDLNPGGGSAIAITVVRTIRPNLINENTLGANYTHQKTGPLFPDEFKAENDLSNLKDPATGQVVTAPQIFPGNYLNLIPMINFTTLNPQSAGQAVTNAPTFSYDNRWPFDGTDTISNITDNLTWVKGNHNLKFGFYLEHVARNVSVYSSYNSAGTYYFGSDSANPNDTGYAYSNLLNGSVQAYGQDNKKQTNHARYYQYEWFLQDTWRISRKLNVDLGVRFNLIPPTYSAGATLGIFSGDAYDPAKTGQLLFPSCTIAVSATGSCPAGNRVSVNPKTGVTYPFARRSFFDPASYPSNGFPWSGIVQYDSKFFHTPPVQTGPRVGFAYDLFGNGKTALRGGFGMFFSRPYGVDTIASTGAGVGPLNAPPNFLAPTFYNTTFSTLLSSQAWYGPQSVNGGSQDYANPSTYNWSLGVQQDVGHGMILDISYVANVSHHQFNTSYNANAIQPLTTWSPGGGPNGTLNPLFSDPTNRTALLDTNLIRAMIAYQGYADISSFTSKGESNYNALQAQLNRRFGKTIQFSANYTFQKTIVFAPQQFVDDEITKNVANRKHAVNMNFGWAVPDGSRLWKNFLTKGALDGWHLTGVMSVFSGLPLTVGCAAQSAPVGWPNGTPTGGIPLRCQMNGDLFLPSSAQPPAGVDPKLWYPINSANFTLPSGSTLGLGNTPPTLFWGPGFEDVDLGIYKAFRIGENKVIQFQVETFNSLNHFNPNNPNVSQTINYATGANTNSNFGVVTSAAGNSRRAVVSLKLKF